ncbi:hypothetical protein O7598_02535 [Micromonospora sp. WMMC241]|uniref:hypothetical protein n=1 Tax=Micromonospora sp. WMMC241 TaxID=3015159 RepID=UPI0022B6BB36|nr:hypothetical protein [Micromonospora sp. WMMC241]MCZ7435263.1 hypothetical protein [Micromonospora sp. WMMC241]
MTQRNGTAATVRRIVLRTAAVLATTALAAGCGTGDSSEGAGPAPSASPDPKAALLAAVPNEQDPGFRFLLQDGADKYTGVLDPATEAMDLALKQQNDDPKFTMAMTFRWIDKDLWMRVKLTGLPGLHEMLKLPKRWMAMDRDKLKDEASIPAYQGADPGNTAAVIRTADTVTDKGNGTYTGLADLTDNADVQSTFENVDLKALGEAGRKVPFTAVVGPDGNLTSLTLDVPAAGKQKAMKLVTKYYDYGKAPKIAAPTGDDVQKAPSSAYEMLNG